MNKKRLRKSIIFSVILFLGLSVTSAIGSNFFSQGVVTGKCLGTLIIYSIMLFGLGIMQNPIFDGVSKEQRIILGLVYLLLPLYILVIMIEGNFWSEVVLYSVILGVAYVVHFLALIHLRRKKIKSESKSERTKNLSNNS